MLPNRGAFPDIYRAYERSVTGRHSHNGVFAMLAFCDASPCDRGTMNAAIWRMTFQVQPLHGSDCRMAAEKGYTQTEQTLSSNN
jgi:hypothetical protein